MIFKTYQFYLSKVFSITLLKTFMVFLSLGFILNIFEEINFFKDLEVSIALPIFLTFLNIPSVIFEIFPFIFLIASQFAFIKLMDQNEIIVLKNFGWKVVKVQNLGELSNADLVVLVNPNNPDGRVIEKKEILELASYANEIIIDESFADLRPEISMVRGINDKDITVFKSVGKFFGLPGMRLGFVIAKYSKIRALKKFTGPWNISGPALEVGFRALSDQDWVNKTRQRLEEGSKRLTKLLSSSGKLKVIGSTGLFTLVETRNAKNAQVHFADRKIWTRVFDYSDKWIRLGIPGDEKSWSKLEYALAQFT